MTKKKVYHEDGENDEDDERPPYVNYVSLKRKVKEKEIALNRKAREKELARARKARSRKANGVEDDDDEDSSDDDHGGENLLKSKPTSKVSSKIRKLRNSEIPIPQSTCVSRFSKVCTEKVLKEESLPRGRA